MTLKEIFKTISKNEWQFLVFLSLVVILITTAPIIYGWLITPEDSVFTGMHFVSADDWFVYYSFIQQGKEGRFLFSDLFASENHLPVFRPEWLAVGLLARFFNLPVMVAFQLARILLIPLFFMVAYLFIAYFFENHFQRKLALVFLTFSSGVGTFFISQLTQYPLNYAAGHFRWPMDLWVPDLNTFLTIYTSPHFLAATILLFLIFLFSVLFTENNNYFLAVFAGFCGLVLFSFHPFQVLKVFVILGSFFLLLTVMAKKIIWPLIRYYLIFLIISLPSIFYYLWLLANDWLMRQRALQNINPSAPLHLAIASFGGLFVFAALGIYFLFSQRKLFESKYLFAVNWLIVQFFLLYAPVNYQRRLSLGLHFPFVILTMVAFFYIYNLKKEIIKKRLAEIIILGILVFLPSTLFALAADIMVFSQYRELSYLDKDTYSAFLWLKNNTPEKSIIFSDVKTGNVLPAYSLRTSYVGHAVETPLYVQKKLEPAWFFSKDRAKQMEIDFLKRRNINYIFYGKIEKELGSYNPANESYLNLVFSNPQVEIYQVQ